jgi:hypothetical protein
MVDAAFFAVALPIVYLSCHAAMSYPFPEHALWAAIGAAALAWMEVPLPVSLVGGLLIGIPCFICAEALTATRRLCEGSTLQACCSTASAGIHAFTAWAPGLSVAAQASGLSPCVLAVPGFLLRAGAVIAAKLVLLPLCHVLLNGRSVLARSQLQHNGAPCARLSTAGGHNDVDNKVPVMADGPASAHLGPRLGRLLFEPLTLGQRWQSAEARFVEAALAYRVVTRAVLPMLCFPFVMYTFIS